MSETITVTGTVGTTPEQRQVSPGVYVTGFRLASTHRRFDRDRNTWVDAGTSWYDISVFRALGENAFHSIHKGERVIVTGQFKLRAWETDSSKGVSAELTATGIGHDLLWGTSEFRRRDAGPAGQPASVPAHAATVEVDAQAAASTVESDPLAAWGAPAPEQELAETPF